MAIASAWGDADETNDSGVSVFQETVESIIRSRLRSADLDVTDRVIEGRKRKHIVLTILDLELEASIYRDHMQVMNTVTGEPTFCMEWLDDILPDDHYAAADEFFADIVAIHQKRTV